MINPLITATTAMFAWETIGKSFPPKLARLIAELTGVDPSEAQCLPIILHQATTTNLLACLAPLVVEHSGKVLNLIGNFNHVLEDIVAETAITSTADEMLDAANVWLKEARGERSIDIADIASITRGMMKQLAGGDRLERKVIYTGLVEIIESK